MAKIGNTLRPLEAPHSQEVSHGTFGEGAQTTAVICFDAWLALNNAELLPKALK